MHAVLEECKAEYDHVIIDSAPCLIVTDAVLVAQETDAVLLVSRIGVTPRNNLRRASELLRSGDSHVTGIVANDVPIGAEYYGYGYGYPYPYAYYPVPFVSFGYYGGFGRFGGFRR